eukprot:6426234-Amphidinium_carterae.1
MNPKGGACASYHNSSCTYAARTATCAVQMPDTYEWLQGRSEEIKQHKCVALWGTESSYTRPNSSGTRILARQLWTHHCTIAVLFISCELWHATRTPERGTKGVTCTTRPSGKMVPGPESPCTIQ